MEAVTTKTQLIAPGSYRVVFMGHHPPNHGGEKLSNDSSSFAASILMFQERVTTMLNTLTPIFLCTAILLSLASCTSLDTNQKHRSAAGAGVGPGIGAIPGQANGKASETAIIGAGVGTASGGLAERQVGGYMDKQEQELRDAMAQSKAAGIGRNQDALTVTFKGQALFHHDSTVLLPGGYSQILRVVSVLNKYSETQIEVNSHTDATGSEQDNRRLSQRRAESVKNTLVREGVAPQRVVARGYGASQSRSSANAMDRRVEIVIIPLKRD